MVVGWPESNLVCVIAVRGGLQLPRCFLVTPDSPPKQDNNRVVFEKKIQHSQPKISKQIGENFDINMYLTHQKREIVQNIFKGSYERTRSKDIYQVEPI